MELVILFAVLIFICVFVAIALESKDYNNGICPRCGAGMRHFDTDSHGGRGYTCDVCGYHTWVSYGVVDRDFKEVK